MHYLLFSVVGCRILVFFSGSDRSVFPAGRRTSGSGFRLGFSDVGSGRFHGCRIELVSRIRIVRFSDLGLCFGFSDLDPGGFLDLGSCSVFQDLGSFRLLIQRCKIHGDAKTFFDQYSVMPDERKIYPMNVLAEVPKNDVSTVIGWIFSR